MSESREKSRSILEMASDWFREASVLVVVFGLLDWYLQGSKSELGFWYGFSIGVIAIALFCVGVWFEFKRDRKG
jgi:hypothetical protein